MWSEKLGQNFLDSEAVSQARPVMPEPAISGSHLTEEGPAPIDLGIPQRGGGCQPVGDFDLPPRQSAVIDLALKAGAKHRGRLMALREALIAGVCPEEVVVLAREACGLKEVDCNVSNKGR